MVDSCSIRNCDSQLKSGSGIVLHRLPLLNKKLLKKWCKALKFENWTVATEEFYVCNKHFREDDYAKMGGVRCTMLLPSAVPSIFPDSSNREQCLFDDKKKSNILELVKTEKSPKNINKTLPSTSNKDSNQSFCFIQNCKAPKDLPLYNFPINDRRLLHIWAKRIGLSSMYDMDLYLNIKVCKNHFLGRCIDKKSMELFENAIPSINLIDYSGPPDDCWLSYEHYNSSMITGNGTWGWLKCTEYYLREAEPDEFIVVPKLHVLGEKYTYSFRAAHCIIFAENNKKMFNAYNARAAVLMQLRYDGYLGFPGGLVNDGEDIVDAVNKGMVEVMNLDSTLHSVSHDDHVITHWSEKKKFVVHFYKLKVTMTELIEIEKRALLARDYGSEVLGTVRVPLHTLHDQYRGFPAFLKHKFIGCSRDQLLAALVFLNILTAEEIRLALNAKNSSNV